MIAWLSFTYPGFGHLSMGSYITGFLLFLWEMLINTQAGVNLGILYTFTGRYELAKEVLNNRWFLFYAPVFIFAVWDSYRRAIKFNQFSILADRENQTIKPVYISSLEINVLDKCSPWVAVIWSLIAPGLGHLYTHRIPTGFFILIWWIIISYIRSVKCSCLLGPIKPYV